MPNLLQELKSNQKKIFLQFGGQGAPYLKEVSKLYEEPELKEYFSTVFSALKELESIFHQNDSRYSNGFDLSSWITNPESAPSEDYLIREAYPFP